MGNLDQVFDELLNAPFPQENIRILLSHFHIVYTSLILSLQLAGCHPRLEPPAVTHVLKRDDRFQNHQSILSRASPPQAGC